MTVGHLAGELIVKEGTGEVKVAEEEAREALPVSGIS